MKTLFFAILVCFASSPARDAQSAIQALYNRQDAAIARKNEPGVLTGVAPDYREVHTEPGARGLTLGLAQLRPMIHSMLVSAKTASRRTAIQDLTYTPDGLIVTVRQRTTLWVPKPPNQYGQIIIYTKSADTWVNGKNGWQEKQSVVLAGQTKVLLHAGTAAKSSQ